MGKLFYSTVVLVASEWGNYRHTEYVCSDCSLNAELALACNLFYHWCFYFVVGSDLVISHFRLSFVWSIVFSVHCKLYAKRYLFLCHGYLCVNNDNRPVR